MTRTGCVLFCGAGSRLIFYCLLEVLVIAKELLINEQIKIKEARMLDENGNQLGIMSLSEARSYAFDHGVDQIGRASCRERV